VRLSYVKVAEFQRRGLVHVHVVVRADGPSGPSDPPPSWVDRQLLAAAVRASVKSAAVRTPFGHSIGWGTQIDVAAIGEPGDEDGTPSSVASYLAGYSVKSSEETGALARRLRTIGELDGRRLRPHIATLVRTAWEMGGDPRLAELRLRDHAHTFGYRGQFATTSRAYSTTMGALRAVRTAYGRPATETRAGAWRFAGRGYDTPEAATLAQVFFEVRPRGRAVAAPDRSPDVETTVEKEARR
jgi:hypothetical protein